MSHAPPFLKRTHCINSHTLPSAKDIHWKNHHETVSLIVSCLIMITQSFPKRYPVKSMIVTCKISKRYLIFLKDIHSSNSHLLMFQDISHSLMITYFKKSKDIHFINCNSWKFWLSPPKACVIIIPDSRVLVTCFRSSDSLQPLKTTTRVSAASP